MPTERAGGQSATAPTAAQAPAQPYIRETLTTRTLHFSVSELQSRMDIRQPDALDLEYTRLMMGFLLFSPTPLNLLMVGLGGGSLVKFCLRHLPRCEVHVLEINPQVIALREAFQIPPDGPRLQVLQADGAEHLRRPPHPSPQHDVLLLDGFDEHGLPECLCSQRFYDDCAAALRPGGVLVANLHVGHARYGEQVERIRRSFGGVCLVVQDSDGSNGIVFACQGDALAQLRIGPLRRPKALHAAGWPALQAPFARILSALKSELG